ncbi:hypothetical protein [Helicobacter rodentium]|uniref:hypothetical protein n=1 Tax=Helicobacter rodentium TaxID=59617 RepID=UPI0025A6699E|nr:hypothetical protein [Helicobacter rodentium]
MTKELNYLAIVRTNRTKQSIITAKFIIKLYVHISRFYCLIYFVQSDRLPRKFFKFFRKDKRCATIPCRISQ